MTLQSAFISASYYAISRSKLLKKIETVFSENRIPYLVFKGAEVAKYYQHPNLRTSCDIDILVKLANKEKAGEILETFGFMNDGKKKNDHEWCYHKSDFEVEIHHRLLYDDKFNNMAILNFTDTAWEHAATADGIQYHLEPEFHFVFLLLHLRKHFLWSGVGIRQFVDLAVMARNADLDWSKVEKYTKTCRIQQFSSTCFALINRWFGVSIPLLTTSVTDDFYCQATNTVLSGSVFGDMSSENFSDNSVFNTTQKHGKLRSALAVLFPSYSKFSLRYPILSRYPFLLPFFWIRRMVGALFKHTAKDGLSYAAKYLNPKKERGEELKEWGLIDVI